MPAPSLVLPPVGGENKQDSVWTPDKLPYTGHGKEAQMHSAPSACCPISGVEAGDCLAFKPSRDHSQPLNVPPGTGMVAGTAICLSNRREGALEGRVCESFASACVCFVGQRGVRSSRLTLWPFGRVGQKWARPSSLGSQKSIALLDFWKRTHFCFLNEGAFYFNLKKKQTYL